MKRSVTGLLALAIAFLLIANNAVFLFHQPYYEYWDSAANSLSVIRAKHFAQLYGPYSHWGFFHPGPALFYTEALGEWLFFDCLHWTLAPFNAQLCGHVFVMSGFFAAALQIFTRRLAPAGRYPFLVFAVCAAAGHFGAKPELSSFYDLFGGPLPFLSNWSAHALVLPFLCLLTAGASVASGEGQDLPLLVLAGGFLVHAHVAQPLFVVPTALLSYGALLRECARRERLLVGRPGWRLAAGWRACPRAHLLAGGLLAAFLLPMVVDLFLGRESNFAAILRHIHAHRAEHKALARSLVYFLQFGAYHSYQPGARFFARYDLRGALVYLWTHALLMTLWATVAGMAGWAVLAHAGIKEPPSSVGHGGDRAANPGRFLAWSGGLLFLSVATTLYWGTIQDGEMLYYNSWFNFAIYYFGLLIALAVLCRALSTRWRRWSATCWGRLLPAALVAVVCWRSAGGWRIADPTLDVDRAIHENILRAIRITAATSVPHACKSLVFGDIDWYQAVGVALQLERAGEPYVVPEHWKSRFGVQHDWRRLSAGSPRAVLRRWRFEGPITFPAQPSSIPSLGLRNAVSLNIGLPRLELSAAHPIALFDFQTGGNATDLMVGGWFRAESWGAWSDAPLAIMEFEAQPISNGSVELRVEAGPMLMPTRGVTAQRIGVSLNGRPIGSEQQLTEWAAKSMVFHIPARQWNQAALGNNACATLEFDFPDAFVPAALDPGHSPDIRMLGASFRQMQFHWMPPAP